MFKDITLSEELTHEFKGSQLGKNHHLELNLKVLTTGNWPNEQKDLNLHYLPRELSLSIQQFTRFYMNKHQGRQLNWKPSLGSTDLRAVLGTENKKFELTTSTY